MTITINNPNRRIIYSRDESGVVYVRHYIDTFSYNECVLSELVSDLESFDMKGISDHVAKFMNDGVLHIPMQVTVYDKGKKVYNFIQHEKLEI
jgi:hypothetical protein